MSISEVTKGAIRLIVTAVLLINAYLTSKGINPIPFDESAVTEVLTQVAAGISCVWAWWKDNNMTKSAQEKKTVAEAVISGEVDVVTAEETSGDATTDVEDAETEA